VPTGVLSGARLNAGYWFDEEHCWGLDGSAFFLAQQTVNFSSDGPGAPVTIWRPGFVHGLGQVAEAVSAFNPAAGFNVIGTANVVLTNRLWGAEANLRTNLFRTDCFNLDLLGGFRFLALDDSLQVSESLAITLPEELGLPTVSVLQVDRFATKNRFFGGQIGLNAEIRRGPWFLDVRTKVALGGVRQVVDISSIAVQNPGFQGLYPTSWLTDPTTNVGHYSRERFAVLPEVGLNLGYHLTDGLRVFAGYTFMYLSSVVRAGNQVDFTIGPLPHPAFAFQGSDFWVHGVNFGLEWRY
jgi:hypothetical protein